MRRRGWQHAPSEVHPWTPVALGARGISKLAVLFLAGWLPGSAALGGLGTLRPLGRLDGRSLLDRPLARLLGRLGGGPPGDLRCSTLLAGHSGALLLRCRFGRRRRLLASSGFARGGFGSSGLGCSPDGLDALLRRGFGLGL